LGQATAPQHLWIAYFVALGGALFQGRVDLAEDDTNRVLPVAREDRR
jgi:hypothetical protein